jgi:AmmeMemoRadiSam system protein B
MGVTPLKASIRPPIVDGLFYPAKREALGSLVDELMAHSVVPEGASFAVISPHAGYEYAGEVMAAAMRAIARRPVRTAVIIGPVHRDSGKGFFLPESERFATPLGDLAVDEEAVSALCASDPLFRRDDIPHLEEHCLEVHLPFLARLFPGLSLVPLLLGTATAAMVATLSRCLALTFAGKAEHTVFIASANMASYMTGRDIAAENAALEELLANCDGRGVLAAAEKRRISTCGAAAIAALISLAGEGCRARVLARGSSLGRDDDIMRIVHYAAVSIDRNEHSEG